MIPRELRSWNKTDDGTVGDSEEFTTNTSLDMPSFFFYAALSLFSFILLFQVYLKCRYRASGSVDAEIPEPQASFPGVEVVKKSVGERRKEILAGFEEHKVQRVSKLKIVKTCFDVNVILMQPPFILSIDSMLSGSVRGGLKGQRRC
jgi:hypothetical protein